MRHSTGQASHTTMPSPLALAAASAASSGVSVEATGSGFGSVMVAKVEPQRRRGTERSSRTIFPCASEKAGSHRALRARFHGLSASLRLCGSFFPTLDGRQHAGGRGGDAGDAGAGGVVDRAEDGGG